MGLDVVSVGCDGVLLQFYDPEAKALQNKRCIIEVSSVLLFIEETGAIISVATHER